MTRTLILLQVAALLGSPQARADEYERAQSGSQTQFQDTRAQTVQQFKDQVNQPKGAEGNASGAASAGPSAPATPEPLKVINYGANIGQRWVNEYCQRYNYAIKQFEAEMQAKQGGGGGLAGLLGGESPAAGPGASSSSSGDELGAGGAPDPSVTGSPTPQKGISQVDDMSKEEAIAAWTRNEMQEHEQEKSGSPAIRLEHLMLPMQDKIKTLPDQGNILQDRILKPLQNQWEFFRKGVRNPRPGTHYNELMSYILYQYATNDACMEAMHSLLSNPSLAQNGEEAKITGKSKVYEYALKGALYAQFAFWFLDWEGPLANKWEWVWERYENVASSVTSRAWRDTLGIAVAKTGEVLRAGAKWISKDGVIWVWDGTKRGWVKVKDVVKDKVGRGLWYFGTRSWGRMKAGWQMVGPGAQERLASRQNQLMAEVRAADAELGIRHDGTALGGWERGTDGVVRRVRNQGASVRDGVANTLTENRGAILRDAWNSPMTQMIAGYMKNFLVRDSLGAIVGVAVALDENSEPIKIDPVEGRASVDYITVMRLNETLNTYIDDINQMDQEIRKKDKPDEVDMDKVNARLSHYLNRMMEIVRYQESVSKRLKFLQDVSEYRDTKLMAGGANIPVSYIKTMDSLLDQFQSLKYRPKNLDRRERFESFARGNALMSALVRNSDEQLKKLEVTSVALAPINVAMLRLERLNQKIAFINNALTAAVKAPQPAVSGTKPAG